MNEKQRGKDKMRRAIKIPIEVTNSALKKPEWLKIKLPSQPEKVANLKSLLREQKMVTVCEEASCPNLYECFQKGTATFMIMGDMCTRRCTFCDVAHGRPQPLDANEPYRLGQTIKTLNLKYVVITSVDRDDLTDGGAQHFANVISEIRKNSPEVIIEILTPDFRGRQHRALPIINSNPPDVFNHNIETVPSLYKQARPGSSYEDSLKLLREFKESNPTIPTKSGLMLGLGESIEELHAVFQDMRKNKIDRLTIGQYLQPSPSHHPVIRYVKPEEFKELKDYAYSLGFEHVASGPLVRSSYHADKQNSGEIVE